MLFRRLAKSLQFNKTDLIIFIGIQYVYTLLYTIFYTENITLVKSNLLTCVLSLLIQWGSVFFFFIYKVCQFHCFVFWRWFCCSNNMGKSVNNPRVFSSINIDTIRYGTMTYFILSSRAVYAFMCVFFFSNTKITQCIWVYAFVMRIERVLFSYV